MAKKAKKKPVNKKNKKASKTIPQKKKELLVALEENFGLVSYASKIVGLSRQTFYTYYNSDDVFAKKVDAISEDCIDEAIMLLVRNMRDGDTASIKYFLSTKAKHRGFSEKVDIDVKHQIEQIVIKPYEIGDGEDTLDITPPENK